MAPAGAEPMPEPTKAASVTSGVAEGVCLSRELITTPQKRVHIALAMV